jgi:AcrR family transcriptional regulator
MVEKRDYHHGDLRAALIEAGIALLEERGWDGLSLRSCAARAGVSHAAPAHHFGNARGLRTAIATSGFDRFRETLEAHRGKVPEDDPAARLSAAGEGYTRFALDHPGLFRLIFGDADLDRDDEAFRAAQRAAYAQLGDIVAPFLPEDATPDDDHRLRVTVWSAVHGYAHLRLAGRLDMLTGPDGTPIAPPNLAGIVSGA